MQPLVNTYQPYAVNNLCLLLIHGFRLFCEEKHRPGQGMHDLRCHLCSRVSASAVEILGFDKKVDKKQGQQVAASMYFAIFCLLLGNIWTGDER